MQELKIEATKSSPMILFDSSNKKVIIKGKSYPENAFDFYNSIVEKLKQFLTDIKDNITVEMDLTYLNTSSSKAIIIICDILNEAYKNDHKITVNWYYDKENDLSLECGEEFKEGLLVPFNIIEKE